METSKPAIYSAMANVLRDFGAVEKGRTNNHFGYNFRGIDDALAALHPLLAKHRLFVTIVNMQPQFFEANRCLVTATVRFIADDGSFVEVSMAGEGADKGDKGLMKAQANGLKYCIYYTFCVPTEEPKDSEAFPEPTEEKPLKVKEPKAKASKPTRAETPAVPVAQRTSSPIDITPYLDGIGNATDNESLDAVVSLIKEKSAGLDPGVRKQLVDAIKAKRAAFA